MSKVKKIQCQWRLFCAGWVIVIIHLFVIYRHNATTPARTFYTSLDAISNVSKNSRKLHPGSKTKLFSPPYSTIPLLWHNNSLCHTAYSVHEDFLPVPHQEGGFVRYQDHVVLVGGFDKMIGEMRKFKSNVTFMRFLDSAFTHVYSLSNLKRVDGSIFAVAF